jgi:DNA polymerase III epsilon subunit family exonuclease
MEASTSDHLTNLSSATFSVVDVETTGVYTHFDRIIEIAVVKTKINGEAISILETLVNPNRDLGPTDIHGITSAEVLHAPTFGDIAADVLGTLSNSVLVGHNVRFDIAFLRSEFSRVGIDLPEVPAVCTLHLASRLGIRRRKLADCCEALGLRCCRDHSAAHDAAATAELFLALVRRDGVTSLEALGCDGMPFAFQPAATKAKLCPRGTAAEMISEERGYLSRLVSQLAASTLHPVNNLDFGCYMEVLDRVLEDRKVEPSEANELMRLAQHFGMSSRDAEEAHHSYFAALCQVALEDGVITQSERTDLELVAELLGIGKSSIPTTTSLPNPSPSPLHELHVAEDLQGKTVCFTGQNHLDGEPITREAAEKLAQDAGLLVLPSVTHKLNILVVADPDSLSGKAKKAREYGVRILAEAVFWQKLGVAANSMGAAARM